MVYDKFIEALKFVDDFVSFALGIDYGYGMMKIRYHQKGIQFMLYVFDVLLEKG